MAAKDADLECAFRQLYFQSRKHNDPLLTSKNVSNISSKGLMEKIHEDSIDALKQLSFLSASLLTSNDAVYTNCHLFDQFSHQYALLNAKAIQVKAKANVAAQAEEHDLATVQRLQNLKTANLDPSSLENIENAFKSVYSSF